MERASRVALRGSSPAVVGLLKLTAPSTPPTNFLCPCCEVRVMSSLTHVGDSGVRMVEISGKRDVVRRAVAEGRIRLRRETVALVREGKVEKGNVLATAQIAAILAVKRTPELIPLCHPISITGVEVEFEFAGEEILVRVEVRSVGKTGVEMEALAGVSAALLAIWDMVKAVEKDERGQYPVTMIHGIRVLEKVKQDE